MHRGKLMETFPFFCVWYFSWYFFLFRSRSLFLHQMFCFLRIYYLLRTEYTLCYFPCTTTLSYDFLEFYIDPPWSVPEKITSAFCLLCIVTFIRSWLFPKISISQKHKSHPSDVCWFYYSPTIVLSLSCIITFKVVIIFLFTRLHQPFISPPLN